MGTAGTASPASNDRCFAVRSLTESESIRSESGEVTGNLYLNECIFLANIPHEIWRYELGGYPVLKKWLGYRQANRRTSAALSLLELDELRTMVLRIAALLVVRPLLDVAYSRTVSDTWSPEELSARGGVG